MREQKQFVVEEWAGGAVAHRSCLQPQQVQFALKSSAERIAHTQEHISPHATHVSTSARLSLPLPSTLPVGIFVPDHRSGVVLWLVLTMQVAEVSCVLQWRQGEACSVLRCACEVICCRLSSSAPLCDASAAVAAAGRRHGGIWPGCHGETQRRPCTSEEKTGNRTNTHNNRQSSDVIMLQQGQTTRVEVMKQELTGTKLLRRSLLLSKAVQRAAGFKQSKTSDSIEQTKFNVACAAL